MTRRLRTRRKKAAKLVEGMASSIFVHRDVRMRYQPVNQRSRIRILQVGGLLIAVPLLTMRPALAGDGHEVIEVISLALVLICIAGRMWSILYIGSKKNRELVTTGPYSMTRNPLYFFSVLGAVGIGLFVGSLTLAFLLGLAVYLVLVMTAEKEAEHLEALFGTQYRDYARTTPIFWPKPSLYREAGEVAFSPVALRRTFLDGLLFLIAFPAIEVIEYLHEVAYLPMLFNLL
ncbi:methyltransferase family protein [Chelativorans intermedius]|uniref:Methyltransferase family protein n=1 Tax=Chelativorans intermedius TaxID=515947 RepID=A0ABV6DBH3_9HYPH|nr:isoprenylcysteine carboxylmethyltransferase family protein [Chelativorans intermedius]MCT8999338.1 isoprenylcysteine carboxylmethyltransferase family protein [Chelativorans intermedius]